MYGQYVLICHLYIKQMFEQYVGLQSQNQGVICPGIKLLARSPSCSVVRFLSLLTILVSYAEILVIHSVKGG